MRLAVVALLIVSVQIARGDNAREAAKKHYRVAHALHEAGRYVAAAEEYLRAYELEPEAELLFNAGQAYRLGAQLARAIEYYTRYLALEPEGRGATEAREHVRALRAELDDAARTKPEPKPDPKPEPTIAAKVTPEPAPKPEPNPDPPPKPKPKPPARVIEPVQPAIRPQLQPVQPVPVVVDDGSTAGRLLGFGLKLGAVGAMVGGVWMIGTGIEQFEDESSDFEPNPAADRRLKQYVGGGAGLILGGIVTYYIGKRVSAWSQKKTSLMLVPVTAGRAGMVGLQGRF